MFVSYAKPNGPSIGNGLRNSKVVNNSVHSINTINTIQTIIVISYISAGQLIPIVIF